MFAGQGIEDAKSFLRMHIAADGSLTVYPIAVDRISRTWAADPDGAEGTPWLRPTQRRTVRLIEPPITVTGSGPDKRVIERPASVTGQSGDARADSGGW